VNVIQAMNAVMKEVREVAKSETANIPGQQYKYRGVDQVVEALSGAIREQGIVIAPVSVEPPVYRAAQTTKGNPVNYMTVTVGYRIYGPEGDYIDGASTGEAMDSGDKALSKAMSVAWRTFLLQSFHLPPKDPDPDSEGYEATAGPRVTANPESVRDYDKWVVAVDDCGGDFKLLGEVYQNALKAKAPAAVLSMIKAAGKAASEGGAK
jgi:hypothetical protein